MREIKFRAFDLEEKKMYYFSMGEIKSNMGFEYGIPENLRPVYDVDFNGSDFMLYTCLKDRNGKEIYEGDIIEDKRLGDVREIKWGDVGWEPFVGGLLDGHDVAFFEVIGNIHENEELLSIEPVEDK